MLKRALRKLRLAHAVIESGAFSLPTQQDQDDAAIGMYHVCMPYLLGINIGVYRTKHVYYAAIGMCMHKHIFSN